MRATCGGWWSCRNSSPGTLGTASTFGLIAFEVSFVCLDRCQVCIWISQVGYVVFQQALVEFDCFPFLALYPVNIFGQVGFHPSSEGGFGAVENLTGGVFVDEGIFRHILTLHR